MAPAANPAGSKYTAGGDRPVTSAANYQKWIALPFLLFSGFFFVKFAYVRPPLWESVVTALAYGAFLLFYWRAFAVYMQPRRLRLPVAAFFALGLLLTPLNYGANIFFGYSAWFAGRAFGVSTAIIAVLGICGAVIGLTLLLGLPANFYLPGLLVPIALGLISIFTARAELASRALAKSRDEAEHLATIAERERIARDLHDTVGHALSLVALKSELSARLVAGAPDQAAAEMLAVQRVAREALAEVRETVAGYRHLGLREELTGLVSTLEQSGLEVDIEIPELELPPRMETALALFFREAVTNVLRHSDAGRCTLLVCADDGTLRARVSDDGIGIDGSDGHGLTGMRERAAALGGALEVRNEGGTCVRLTLPLTPQP